MAKQFRTEDDFNDAWVEITEILMDRFGLSIDEWFLTFGHEDCYSELYDICLAKALEANHPLRHGEVRAQDQLCGEKQAVGANLVDVEVPDRLKTV